MGARVAQGTQVAILSDLSHFRIDGEIADSYGDRISTGNKVVVRIGGDELTGVVSSVTPPYRKTVLSSLPCNWKMTATAAFVPD